MNGTQLGAFVSAFGEIWELEAAARQRLKVAGTPWIGPWATFWIIGSGLSLWTVIHKDDWAWLGWTFLAVAYLFWFAGAVESYAAAKVANAELNELRWKEFDLRFQWKAFGLWDSQLRDLRSLRKEYGFDFESEEYRKWWDGVFAQLGTRSQ